MSNSNFFPILPSQQAGAIVVNVFAILSALALLSVVFRILWLSVRMLLRPSTVVSKEYIFFHTQLGYYAACLLFANMFNSIAGLMGLPFLVQRGITQDNYCVAQGFLMQFGNVSTAFFSLTIGIHTFKSFVLRKRQFKALYWTVIPFGWIFSGIVAAIPFFLSQRFGPIYGVNLLSCGIRSAYPEAQFLLHLLPIFIAAAVSAVLYSIIYLVLRGTLVIKGGVRLQLDPEERFKIDKGDGYHRFVAGIAKSMLWYPAAYILLLIPYSVTRLFALSGYVVPFQAVIFAFTCWFMLGVVNVGLLYNTLRVLSPAFDGRSTGRDAEASMSPSTGKRGLDDFPRGEQNRNEVPPPLFSAMYGVGGQDGSLPTFPGRTASISSYYSYPDMSPAVGNNIASISALNRMVVEPSSPPQPSVRQHSRDASDASLLSLSPPPRRPPRPSMMQDPFASPVSQGRSIPREGSISPLLPARTMTRVRTSDATTSVASDLDITGWLAKHDPDGSMPRGYKNQPFSSSSTSPLTPSPLKSSRPLLTGRGGEIRPF